MKRYIVILVLSLNALNSIAQDKSIYYDAIYLENAEKNIVSKKIKLGANVQQLLAQYYPGVNPNRITARFLDSSNTFFEGQFTDETPGGMTNPYAKNIVSSLGGLNVTNFADGLAKFLVERTKAELSVYFFQRFKEDLKNSAELSTLFPATVKVLNTIDKEIYMYEAYLNTLREAFIKDMSTIYTGFKHLSQLERYRHYFKNNPEIYTAISNSLYLIDAYSKGLHAGKVLAEYDTTIIRFTDPTLQKNVRSSILLARLFSESIRSKSKENYWVSYDSIQNSMRDEVFRNIYFGLIYQQSKLQKLSFVIAGRDSSFAGILGHTKPIIDEYGNFVETIASDASQVDELYSLLKAKKKSEVDYNDYYKLYDASLDLIQDGFLFLELPGVNLSNEPNIQRQAARWLSVARNTGELYVDIRTKNYASAILELSVILDSVLVHVPEAGFIVPSTLTPAQIEDIKSFISSRADINGKRFNTTLNIETEINAKIRTMRFTIEGEEHKYLRKVVGLEIIKNNAKNIDKLLDSIPSEADINRYISGKLYLSDDSLKKVVYIMLYDKLEAILVGRKTELTRNLLRYGTFIATVAQAQNSGEVKNAIETIALPAGSASVKRNTAVNISLNAFVGLTGGYEARDNNGHNLWKAYAGLTAPVGVAFSWGNIKGKRKNAGGKSLGCFVSLIDLGSVVSYRFQDTASVISSQITLQNIFSPGLYLHFGFGKCPISILAGGQIGPPLRQVSNNGLKIDSGLYTRLGVTLAVDLPLLNLYTRPYPKDK